MPVCSNCGGSDFVWAENLRTGSIGRGTLSLRSGGELALGTRVCRGCGHADLFVKDPTILRQPHTWRPGEFVPIPPRPPPELRPATPSPPHPAAPTAPPSSPGTLAPASPETTTPPMAGPTAAPQVPPTSSSPATSSDATTAPTAAPPPDAAPGTEAKPAKEAKRPARRKGAKSKPPSSAVLEE